MIFTRAIVLTLADVIDLDHNCVQACCLEHRRPVFTGGIDRDWLHSSRWPCEVRPPRLRVGSLCSGYSGLDLAVQSVLGGSLAWVADNNPGASKILAHHYPDVPNLGDITVTDWSAVEPVDLMCMGFPCTDVSCAGFRAGLREGTRSGVWTYCAQAIAALRPSLVVIENVRGLLSAKADSDLEWCPWCLGDADPELAVRALGAVLADLAGLGFDAEWLTVSASAIGAPHRRERVFVLAWPAADPAVRGRTDGTKGGPNQRGSSGDLMLPSAVMSLLPTPSVADGAGGHLSRSGDRASELLLPGVAKALGSGTLLPTPTAMDSHGARNAASGRSGLKPSVNNDGWTLSDVFWTGESTRPPSPAGSTSSDGPLPRQLSLDEAEYPG